jgi:hypothetical protein
MPARKRADADAKARGRELFKVVPSPEDRFRTAKLAGALNHSITRDLKQGIVDAAAAFGADGLGAGGLTGYLYMLAGEHPKTFATLLVKLLPMQVNSNRTSQSIGTVNVVSVPVDHYLTPDDMKKLTPETVDAVAREIGKVQNGEPDSDPDMIEPY